MKILLVEDNKSIIKGLEYAFAQNGYSCEYCLSLDEAVRKAPFNYDVAVLDIMLPGKDGVEVLKEIRSDSQTAKIPVIMATAKGTEMDKIHGLDTGADDYLVKPFGMMEMVSRIKAVLRRCESVKNEDDIVSIGDIVLNDKEHIVTAKGENVNLTFKEYKILKLFMNNPDIVFSRDKLLSEVWGVDYLGESRTVDMHIKTLRQKLGEAGAQIKTVIGVGYKLGSSK